MKTIQLKINNETLLFDNISQLAIYTIQELAKNNIENFLDSKYIKIPSKKFKFSKHLFEEANI